MKNSFLWVVICVVCLCILMGMGKLMFNKFGLVTRTSSCIILKNEYKMGEEDGNPLFFYKQIIEYNYFKI